MGVPLINNLGGDAGFGENTLPSNDDGSTGFIDLSTIFSTPLNFFGNQYSGLYVNNNGTITFEGALSTFTPFGISGASQPIIAPFFADIDTRGESVTPDGNGTSTGSNLVYYDIDTINNIFTATWDDVGYFDRQTNKTNAFQAQIINTGNGNFDIVFRYEDINWTTGSESDGIDGLGGSVARIGYASGTGNNGLNIFEELPQSGNQDAILAIDEAPAIYRFSVFNQGIFRARSFNNNDPHLVTFDGVGYDFQSVGEFTLYQVADENVEVQVRTKAWLGSTVASVNDALSFKTTDQNIGFYSDNGLFVGTTAVALADGDTFTHGGISVVRNGDVYDFTLTNGDLVSVTDKGAWLNITTAIVSTSTQISGLLGTPDGNLGNDFALRDGTVLENVSAEVIHGTFADSWRVTDETSLFVYADGETTANYTDLNFPSDFITLDMIDPEVLEAARQAARDAGLTEGTVVFDNAVFDIAITGETGFADFDGNLPPEPIFNISDNTAPQAVDDNFFIFEDQVFIEDLLGNDNDDDGNTIQLTAVNNNEDAVGQQINLDSGAIVTVHISGSFEYNPNGAFDYLELGQTATDSFSYDISDGYLGSDQGIVTLTINGVPGFDSTIINGDDDNNTLTGDHKTNTINGFGGSDSLFGSFNNDILYGGEGNDTLHGGNGIDFNYAEGGNDFIFDSDGFKDYHDGGEGKDTLSYKYRSVGINVNLDTGTDQNNSEIVDIENLTGSLFNDTLKGDSGKNFIKGLDGDDRIQGNYFGDVLFGGLGNDQFLFKHISDSTTDNSNGLQDVIGDFETGIDQIMLNRSFASIDDVMITSTITGASLVTVQDTNFAVRVNDIITLEDINIIAI